MMLGILAAAIRRAIAPPVQATSYVVFGTRISPTTTDLRGCAINGADIVVCGNSGEVYHSATDGMSWVVRDAKMGGNNVLCAAYGNGLWLVGGGAGAICSSPDAVNWTLRVSGYTLTDSVFGMKYANGLWVSVGTGGKITTSLDGITWTLRSSGLSSSTTIRSVDFNGGLWVAVGSSGAITTSPDGVTWTPRTSGVTATLARVGHTGALWVALGASGTVITSPDGVTWTLRDAGFGTDAAWGIATGDGRTIITGANGRMAESLDGGVTWAAVTNPFGAVDTLNSAYNAGTWVLVGATGKVATGYNGVPAPVAVGEYWAEQGGWYAGISRYNNTDYHIILADIAADVAGKQWKTTDTTTGATDDFDGMRNTQVMMTAGSALHPAGKHCVDYRGGGFTDWYMPGALELQRVTLSVAAAGQLAIGMPQANTASAYYWGAYEYQASTAVSDRGDGSARFYSNKTATTVRTRPIRRVRVAPLSQRSLPYLNTIGNAVRTVVPPSMTGPRGLDMAPDGLSAMLCGFGTPKIVTYLCPEPYNLTTVAEVAWAADRTILAARFYGDGTKVIVTTNAPWSVRRYSIATPWQFGDSPTLQVEVTSFPGMAAGTGTVFITRDGLKMYRYGFSGGLFEQYTLASPGAIESATLDYSVDLSYAGSLPEVAGFLMADDGRYAWLSKGNFTLNTGEIVMLRLGTPGDLRTARQLGSRATGEGTYVAGHPMSWSDETERLIVVAQKDTRIREYMPTLNR